MKINRFNMDSKRNRFQSEYQLYLSVSEPSRYSIALKTYILKLKKDSFHFTNITTPGRPTLGLI